MKKTVKIHVEDRSSLISKTVGLLPDKKPHPIYFKTRFGLHTFGMKWGIDVLILDNNNTIVSLKENLSPNKSFFWQPIFSQVIELPEGYIDSHSIKIGDIVSLIIDEKAKKV